MVAATGRVASLGSLLLLFFLTLAAGSAFARDPDGTLGLIRTPNDGIPAIVKSGEAFDADLASKADLRLIAADGVAHPLAAEWGELPGGRARATCPVPADLAPGAYALEAGSDRNPRSVFVRDAFPDAYLVAHVTDTHVGREGADEAFRDMVRRVNESQAAFALVTGDLTDQGTPEQFRLFLEILNTCAIPTFVCAGNHDRRDLNYEAAFGPLTYMFRFGPDGYIVFDTKDAVIAPELGSQDADLQRFRRILKPCRWVVGTSHRYDPDMGMRAQIILFVDDPLDLFLAGHEHRALEAAVPWGQTKLVLTPAAVKGAMRLLYVTSGGIATNAGAPPTTGQ